MNKNRLLVAPRVLLCCGLLAILASPSHSDVPPSAPVTIFDTDTSPSPTTREWKFTVAPFGIEHQVRLSLDARIDWKTLSGSNPWMRVAVNGNFLTKPDLLNKPPEFKTRSGLELNWVKGDAWRVIYSPDFEAAIKQQEQPMAVLNVDPYHFVWDVTRYVHPGENQLTIVNLQVLHQPTSLVLRGANIEVGKPQSPPTDTSNVVVPAPTGPLPTYLASDAKTLPLQVSSGPGALMVALGERDFDIGTRTSLPDGGWSNPVALNPQKPLTKGQTQNLTWTTPLYTVKRTIQVGADHVHVADTFTNTTPDLIGVIVEHRLNYPSPPAQVFLAGHEMTGGKLRLHNGANPSAFAQWPDVGVGLLAEDDVFRAHEQSVYDDRGIGLSDDRLGIEPHTSVTLEWSIYPVAHEGEGTGDYWDFANTVRRNWDVNFTIPGPFDFVNAFPGVRPNVGASYGDWVRQRDLKIICGPIAKYPDGTYAHGTGILSAPAWVASQADWVAKLHAAQPEVKSLCYFHAQINTEPQAETTYAADRAYQFDGSPVNYPNKNLLPVYLPTQGSVYGKALRGYLDTCFDTIGADGIYWDEMAFSLIEFTAHAPWDGHTVVIDETTHALKGKLSSVPLLMQPLDLDIVHDVRGRHKSLMGNSQAVTRSMMQEKIVRFVETGTYSGLSDTIWGVRSDWAIIRSKAHRQRAPYMCARFCNMAPCITGIPTTMIPPLGILRA